MNNYFKERLDDYSHLLAVLFSGMDAVMIENDAGEQLKKQTFAVFDTLLREIMSIIKDAKTSETVSK